MRLSASILGILSLIVALDAFASPARAQATRTWVSGVGDDVNPCSRTAPCKTFAGAISKTAAGGEINCIDPGGFGAVTITKAIIIDCANVESGVVVAGTNGIIVNAGVADRVVLRGLDIIGTVAVPGLNGVSFLAGASLSVEKCTIREFLSAAPNGNGILFQPVGASSLSVSDTAISNNSNAGINVRPTGTGSARASAVRTTVTSNGIGFHVDSSAPTSGIVSFIVSQSVATANTTGVSALSTATSGSAAINFVNSVSSVNITGMSSSGANAFVIAGGSTIWNNDTGLSTSAGGSMISYSNNQMGNTIAGSFTASIGLQ